MEGGSELRPWDELIPDALGMIFNNLNIQEILTVIPRVCKSWGKVVAGPYCWQEIDIEEWSTFCKPDHLIRMLQMLTDRSGGSLRKLVVSSIHSDDVFSFIADNGASLQDLRVPRSAISNTVVENVAEKFRNIKFLDVGYCYNIGAPALEAIGKHCKSLEVLHRVMHPLTVEDKICQNDEALAIATTMPKLKQLELAYLLVDTDHVLEILKNCSHLEYLDLRGCWEVKLDDKLLKEKFPGLKVLGPVVEDSIEEAYWENCSDFSDSESFLAWEFLAGQLDDEDYNYYATFDDDDESFGDAWDDEVQLEELELRFYEGFDGAA